MYNLISKKSFLSLPIYKHLLFWIGVFSYFIITLDINYFSGYQQAVDSSIIYLLCQIIIAYVCLYFLIPKFLIHKKHLLFAVGLVLLLIVVYAIFAGLHEYYYHPKYAEFYSSNSKPYFKRSTWDNLINIPSFTRKSTKFLTPTILLVIAKFYKNQQKYLKLNEQKKSTELATLKHQLNPHFLFNTLNNLYALSISKSDEAPEVIAKLSEMLDYMLYGCNDKYVALQKEIELIENYLALEKVRYDDRVNIRFIKDVEKEAKIAPLLLLTFIENAFKHGVSQELKEADIQVKISLKENYIYFNIENSISKNKVLSNKQNIGLNNVKKQLELLYPEEYSLVIKEENNRFQVHLKLRAK